MMRARRSDESYQRLFERHPQPTWVFDLGSLRILAVNDAAVATYGYSREEFLAMTIADLRPPEDRPALEAALRDANRRYVTAGVWRHRRKDGSLIDVKITSNSIEFDGHDARLVLAEDITVQSGLEEQLRRAQKMEAIGNLAGGIAHDFNNILLVIRGHTAMLVDGLGEGALRSSAEQIDHAAARASEFTHQLLAFSRQQVLEPELVDLNALVDEMVRMLSRLLGEVRVDLRLSAGVAPIVVDRSRLAQAILNLVVNARDAMPDGGTLRIRTANVELDQAYASRHTEVVPGPYVLLQMTDSGIGMDAATRARVFEPYFTTKETGTGTGLATVFGLVQQSNGSISLFSEPQMGATFKLYFPRAGTEITTPVQQRAELDALEGTETILLVEDNETVRSLVVEVLESYGYSVLAAADGHEALELAARWPNSIDVLMTDVVMPHMTGRALAEQMLALDPAVRVLFTSGFPLDPSREGIVKARYGFIEKPYLPVELARTLRQLLA